MLNLLKINTFLKTKYDGNYTKYNGGGVIFQIQLVGTYSSQIDKVEIILTTDSHGNNLYEKLAEITPTGALIKVYVP